MTKSELETILAALDNAPGNYYEDSQVATHYKAIELVQNELSKLKVPDFTTGHCSNKKSYGGCQLHNLQCGYPNCDRKYE
jgi:hypothetical protein